jgi:hypothetical protein
MSVKYHFEENINDDDSVEVLRVVRILSLSTEARKLTRYNGASSHLH